MTKNLEEQLGEALVERDQRAYTAGFQAALDKVDKILQDELALAHTTTAGKTSRLTSAINRITNLHQ